jgi:hypothetical protein
MSLRCPSCLTNISLFDAHRVEFPCPNCSAGLRIDNFYSVIVWTSILGNIPMIFALTPVGWLIAIAISIVLMIVLYAMMIRVTLVRR